MLMKSVDLQEALTYYALKAGSALFQSQGERGLKILTNWKSWSFWGTILFVHLAL